MIKRKTKAVIIEENAQLRAKNAQLLALLAKVWFGVVEAGTTLEKSLDKDSK